jgi:hypothetical protein
MPDSEPADIPIVEQKASLCRHLRSGGMYVYSDDQDRGSDDEYQNTVYWCVKSLKNFGPDDELVGRSECRDPARSCYEPI